MERGCHQNAAHIGDFAGRGEEGEHVLELGLRVELVDEDGPQVALELLELPL